MSWMKRRSHTTPSPAPAPNVQMYNPNQHSNEEWHHQDVSSSASTNNWYNQQQQNPQAKPYMYDSSHQQHNYWQQPYDMQQQTYNQNEAHQYPQQQSSYNQPIQNQSNFYENPSDQPSLVNDQYNQQPQYNYSKAEVQIKPGIQQTVKQDADAWGNWGWGDEDNSNVQSKETINSNQEHSVTDSFNTEETWNWTVDDSTSTTSNFTKNESSASISHTSLDSYRTQNYEHPENIDAIFPKVGKLFEKQNQGNLETDDDKRDPSRVSQLRKLDHLTPQWSTESQMSQESSDDLLQTSESDKILSRSSTISQSPISGQEPSNIDNLPQIEEKYETENPNQDIKIKRELDDIDQKQFENVEILSNIKEELLHPPSSSFSIKNESTSLVSSNQTPPPPMKNQTPPPLIKNQALSLVEQVSSDDVKNPYKRTSGVSHKAANKAISNSSLPDSRFHPGNYALFNQSVNLETLPDNSEHPDNLVPVQASQHIRKISSGSQQIPDNNEMAPISERNQYLETGRLSDENAVQVVQDNFDTLPPPGLRRMVLGQLENNDAIVQSNDEPPPGLSRMVLGQTENSSSLKATQDPIGFTRMIPGESSSPETSSRQYQSYIDESRRDNYNSGGEHNMANIIPQPRSATIGADTPPSPNVLQNNRSETIGSDSNLDKDKKSKDDTLARPESIDGQPRDHELVSLASGIRDLTMDSNYSNGDERRKESSDSDREENQKSPRHKRDHRYRDDRSDKRYSPDNYHEQKNDRRRYTRRYKDDPDYYSDKEKDRRRDDREKRDDYGGKYNSLRKDKDKNRRRRDYDRRNYETRDYERKDGRDGRDYDRRDPRDMDRSRSKGDYYGRYDDGYDDSQRSRPSSRSDSMHDSYRERQDDNRRHRNRDRDRTSRRPRDFNPYMQGYGGYDPYHPYYQQYQLYYENLRRTNPQAYAEWYRKYFQQATGVPSGTFGTEDRASVHSGRSSANDELKDRYLRPGYYSHTSLPHIGGYYREARSLTGQYGIDDSSYSRPYDATDSSIILDDSMSQPQRSTPAKFSTAHIKASISSGKCVKILPHYPMDGQNAVIEFINMQDLLINDDELEELVGFPGPLVRGVTHKKTVIEFCENKILKANYNGDITDPDSYILMWQLMILLIRQNGMVVGTDIAELLMKEKQENSLRPSSVTSNTSSMLNEGAACSEASNIQTESAGNTPLSGLREEIVTNKFREYLIYGSEKEALEWAMKHGLWGHALFLASKLDKRTYANVMMRFANGLTMNDPLQTLYQLLSGRLPASVTCVADEKWGDWRPHLAMILSNTTSRPELDRKAITTLADTLMSRGSLYAAQFCYLMAEVGFSGYGSEAAKLVLLGSNHNKPYMEFSTNEAIHLTEIYEYACSLNDPEFIIMEFQPYKYLIATRLSDRGLLEKALAYLDRVSAAIIRNPSSVPPSLIDKVCNLADRLKHCDPIGDVEDTSGLETDFDMSRPDTSWLKDLKTIQNDYTMGLISHNGNVQTPITDYDILQQPHSYDQQSQETWQDHQHSDVHQATQQNQWASQHNYEQVLSDTQVKEHVDEGYHNQYEPDQQQSYWANQQQQWPESSQSSLDQYIPHQQENQSDQHQHQQSDYWNNAQNEPTDEVEKATEEELPRPQISMPNQSKALYDDHENKSKDGDQKKDNIPKIQSSAKNDQQGNSGWFGGIFSKLALRPKNQMKLPDDKNPSIVWDPEKKKWVNLEEESNDVTSELKPPPKMSDLMPNLNAATLHNQQSMHTNVLAMSNQTVYDPGVQSNVVQQPQQYAPTLNAPIANTIPTSVPTRGDDCPKPNQPNMFKLQRNRNLKKSYVDVFNPGAKPTSSSAIAQSPLMINPVATGEPHMNFFIPAPINDPNAPTDFLTPGPVNNDDQEQYQAQ